MFDRYHITPGSSYVSVNKTVHEHRAPTDESLRLLTEMEEKVLTRIVKSAVLNGDGIDIAMVVMERSPVEMGYTLKAGLKFNGKWEMITTPISHRDYQQYLGDMSSLYMMLCEKLALRLANILVGKLKFDLVRGVQIE